MGYFKKIIRFYIFYLNIHIKFGNNFLTVVNVSVSIFEMSFLMIYITLFKSTYRKL